MNILAINYMNTIKSSSPNKLIQARVRENSAKKATIGLIAGAVVIGAIALIAYYLGQHLGPTIHPYLFKAMYWGAVALGGLSALTGIGAFVAYRVNRYYNGKWTPENIVTALSASGESTSPLMKSILISMEKKLKATDALNKLLNEQDLIGNMSNKEFQKLMKYLHKNENKIDEKILTKLAQSPKKVLSNLMFIEPTLFEKIYKKNQVDFDGLMVSKAQEVAEQISIQNLDDKHKYEKLIEAFGESISLELPTAYDDFVTLMWRANLAANVRNLFQNLNVFNKTENLNTILKLEESFDSVFRKK